MHKPPQPMYKSFETYDQSYKADPWNQGVTTIELQYLDKQQKDRMLQN